MWSIIIEFVLSLLVCVTLAYYLFLTTPIDSNLHHHTTKKKKKKKNRKWGNNSETIKSNEENEKSIEGKESYDKSRSNSSSSSSSNSDSDSDSEDDCGNQDYTKFYEETSEEEEEYRENLDKDKSKKEKAENAKLKYTTQTKRLGARKLEKINHHSLYTSSTSVISHYLQQLCRLIEVYVLRNAQEWRPEQVHHHHHHHKKKNTSHKCNNENKSDSASQPAGGKSHKHHRHPNEFTTQSMESAEWVNVIMQIVGCVVFGYGQLDHGTWEQTCTQYLQQIVEKCSKTIESKGYVPITSRGDDHTYYDCMPRKAMELCLLHLNCINTNTPSCKSSLPSSILQLSSSSSELAKVHNLWTHAESVVQRHVTITSLNKGEVSKQKIEMGVVLPHIGKHITYERTRRTNNVESNSEQIICCSCNEETLYYEPQRQYKRRFVIPFTYKDNKFVSELECSLPLLAFLPELLRIPSDVLTIDGKVWISKLCFTGELSLCFYDNVVEVCFVKPPEFSASMHLLENDMYNTSRSTKLPLLFMQEPVKPTSEQNKSYTGINTIKNIKVQTHTQIKDDNVKTKEQTYSATTQFLQNGAKLEQLALIAIRNALASITYPSALRITMTLDLSNMLFMASDDDVYNGNTKYKIPRWITTVDKINVEKS